MGTVPDTLEVAISRNRGPDQTLNHVIVVMSDPHRAHPRDEGRSQSHLRTSRSCTIAPRRDAPGPGSAADRSSHDERMSVIASHSSACATRAVPRIRAQLPSSAARRVPHASMGRRVRSPMRATAHSLMSSSSWSTRAPFAERPCIAPRAAAARLRRGATPSCGRLTPLKLWLA